VERTNRGTVLLAVTDTGYGMDQETMHKAFEPFFTTKPAHEGTGLGLSTCHGIVVQAGGRIRLSSELGRGTRVEIELPLAAAAKNRTAASKRPEASEGQGGGRVLIVEDDPAVQRIAVQTLERAGYEVHAATHADRALEMLRLHAIDMIVCDLVLPGMSGPDLIDRVRQTQPGMRVLFVSGYSSELARIGIEPFLPKPYSPEVLRRRVADALAT
jgi:two-component system cell cycle sensor histidine kinase/response regulator CckA